MASTLAIWVALIGAAAVIVSAYIGFVGVLLAAIVDTVLSHWLESRRKA